MPEPATITVTLPLPPKELSPNSRAHWRRKAHRAAHYRWDAQVMLLHRTLPATSPWKAATVKCRFYFPTAQSHDRDNLLASAKAAFDGFADAGLVKNDAQFTYEPVEYEKDASNPRVEITITELGDRP